MTERQPSTSTPESDASIPTEADAISALQRLGLSKYEASVFVALQKLETGTASEVDRVGSVPRSQVYGAAERLEQLGLIEVQQSNPIQYRAIDLDEARARLRARLDSEERDAFDYLESARGEHAEDTETQVDVWTVQGQATINNRIEELAEMADERIFFGAADVSMLNDAIVDALTAAARLGVDVTVISETPAVCERFAATDGIVTHVVCEDPMIETQSGRVLIVDSDTVLLSVLGSDELPDPDREAAIWSAGTGFAVVFIGLLDGWSNHYLDRD